jgi:hypothetical protein
MKTDPDVVEANYLSILWRSKDSPQTRRMDLLKRLASVVINRDETWDYAALRVEALPSDLEPWCFVCGDTERKLHQHHAIQLQHGGSNSRRNIVNLCAACHAEIHPWLNRPTTHANVRGWTKVSDMLPWLADRLERLFGRRGKLPTGRER